MLKIYLTKLWTVRLFLNVNVRSSIDLTQKIVEMHFVQKKYNYNVMLLLLLCYLRIITPKDIGPETGWRSVATRLITRGEHTFMMVPTRSMKCVPS